MLNNVTWIIFVIKLLGIVPKISLLCKNRILSIYNDNNNILKTFLNLNSKNWYKIFKSFCNYTPSTFDYIFPDFINLGINKNIIYDSQFMYLSIKHAIFIIKHVKCNDIDKFLISYKYCKVNTKNKN